MRRIDSPGLIDHLESAQLHLWVVAIVFFGLGDVITTSIGLSMSAVHEAGPITGFFIDRYGHLSMVAVKIALFVGFYVIWKLTPSQYRVGVPLGLAVLGVTVVWWNLFIKTLAIYL